jgi:hypothetical protein
MPKDSSRAIMSELSDKSQTNQPLFRDREDQLNTVPEGCGECRGNRGSSKEHNDDGSDGRIHSVTGVRFGRIEK